MKTAFDKLGPARAIVIGAALFAGLTTLPAHATIVTFDQIRDSSAGNPVIPTISGRSVPVDYANRVSAAVMNVPGGQFTYGEAGEGFTPNVVTQFFSGAASTIGSGVSLWQDGYGDLVNVLFANNISNFLAVRLTADAGYSVGLFGFDLAGWPSADYVINGVRVIGDSNTLFSQTNVLVEGNATGPRHTAFDFGADLFASDLLLEIDFGNLAGGIHDNIGLDNLRFGQNPPPPEPDDDPGPAQVPEPGTLALLGISLLGGWITRKSDSAAKGRRRSADAARADRTPV